MVEGTKIIRMIVASTATASAATFCSDRNKLLPAPSSTASNQIPGANELDNSKNGTWTSDDKHQNFGSQIRLAVGPLFIAGILYG